ncbi:MAG: zinc-ribbon domain containing protein [Clostridia bacterium]|nr:zinc-ribbon domain containing protein [Clostridia bacterium]MDD4047484.1 zinc-ribbon domain containing protein [Clostridia bacterium]
MEDKVLICKDCGREFVFTVQEQEFFEEKGFQNEPTRCLDCRKIRRQHNNREERKFYTVNCDECGIETQVPFKPTGIKPVYCRDCMQKKGL